MGNSEFFTVVLLGWKETLSASEESASGAYQSVSRGPLPMCGTLRFLGEHSLRWCKYNGSAI